MGVPLSAVRVTSVSPPRPSRPPSPVPPSFSFRCDESVGMKNEKYVFFFLSPYVRKSRVLFRYFTRSSPLFAAKRYIDPKYNGQNSPLFAAVCWWHLTRLPSLLVFSFLLLVCFQLFGDEINSRIDFRLIELIHSILTRRDEL